MSGGARIWKVSYHNGSLSALVEAETPERAVEIAKAHRETKRVFKGHPPREVIEDHYDVATATEREIAWARKFGASVYTDMPEKPSKKGLRARKRPEGTTEGAEAITRAGGAFGEAAYHTIASVRLAG